MAPQQPTAGLVSSYTLSEARMANDAIRPSAPSQPAQGDRVPFESFEALLRNLSTSRPIRGCTGSRGPP